MDRRGQRLMAVFGLGVIAFNYPLLSLASIDGRVFGIPILYVYLFTLWAILIGLVAIIVERDE